jgi:hypothetical protein
MLLGGPVVPFDEFGAAMTGQLARAVGLSPWISVALAMLVLGLLGLWLVRRTGAARGPSRAALAAGLLTLAVLLAQSAAAWVWPTHSLNTWRDGFPEDLAWLDKQAGGPVASLIVSSNHPRSPTVEFFNRDVERVYALDSADTGRTQGGVCSWTIGPTGEAVFATDCGPAPTRLYLNDPAARITFAGQRTVARTRGTGRIVEIPGPPAVPNVDALLVLPCDDRTLLDENGRAQTYGARVCRPLMSGYFWLDEPATLVLGVQGGERAHEARSGERRWKIPAGKVTEIRIPVPAGSSQLELKFDEFELPLGYPDIASAKLVSDGQTTDLM